MAFKKMIINPFDGAMHLGKNQILATKRNLEFI
jgi:hypothetical protein